MYNNVFRRKYVHKYRMCIDIDIDIDTLPIPAFILMCVDTFLLPTTAYM
jgi:hypothetical protein